MKLIIALFVFFPLVSLANVIGVDTQNFNPTTDGLDYVTVQSSDVLEPGILNFGLFFNYAVDSLPYLEELAITPSTKDFNDSLTTADFSFGLGITKNWEVGLNFPWLLRQKIDNEQNLGQFFSTGNTEIRLSTKYRVLDYKNFGLAFAGSISLSRIKNSPFTGADPGPITNVEMIVDTGFDKFNLAWNIGYRFRDPGEEVPGFNMKPLPDQWISSIATSYLFSGADTKLIFEIFGSYPKDSGSNVTDRHLSSFEALVGAKYNWNTNVAVHFGGGHEIGHGTSTPEWRAYAGLNWTLGPVWKKPQFEERVHQEERLEVRTLVLSNIHFEFNSSELTQESKDSYEQALASIKKTKSIQKIIVEGHTDSVGRASYNQKLSEKRAKAIAAQLKKDLIEASNLVESMGYGEDMPIADNGNFQGRNKNRRVEIKIYKEIKILQ